MELLGDCVANRRFGIPPAHTSDSKTTKAARVLDDVYFECKKTGGSLEDSILVTTRDGALSRVSVTVGDGLGWSRLCIQTKAELNQGQSSLFCVRLVFKISAPSLSKQKLFPIIANTRIDGRQHQELFRGDTPLRLESGCWYQLSGIFATTQQPENSKNALIFPLIANSRAEFARVDVIAYPVDTLVSSKNRDTRADEVEGFELTALKTKNNYPVFDENHVFASHVDLSEHQLSGFFLDSQGANKILLKSAGIGEPNNLEVETNYPVTAFNNFSLPNGFCFDLKQLSGLSSSCSLSAYSESQPELKTKFYFGKPVDSLTRLVDVDYIVQQALRLRRLTEKNSLTFEEAVNLLKDDLSLEIRPNPLFDPQFVAAELDLGGKLSTHQILEAYLSDRRNWSIKTSALFCAEVFGPPADAPILVEYLRNRDLWDISPHPLFNVDYFIKYAARISTIDTAPLAQYVKTAARFNLSPCAHFDNYFYATQFKEVWDEKISALEHYVTTGLGEPKAGFRSYLRTVDAQKYPGAPAWEILNAEKSGFSKYLNGNRKSQTSTGELGILVQMTPKHPRNPYYRQLPYLFSARQVDFRHSVDIDDMLVFGSKKKTGLTLWFHQLEPFYHRGTHSETRKAMLQLVSKLKTLRSFGVNLVHTWHNAVPHDPKYLDIDIELYCLMDDLFDLVIVHSRKSVEWVLKFCQSVTVKVLPHPSLGHHLNYTDEKRLAREILKLPKDKFMFLTFGEIKPYKRVDLLVNAWKAYTQGAEEHSSFLVVAGEWSKDVSTECLSGAKHLALKNRRVSDQDLSLMIAAADACVISHQDIWVSGVAMAAIRFGCPIILPDSAGLTDQVHEPENGFVFKTGDLDSLVSALGRAEHFEDMDSIRTNNRSMDSQLQPEILSENYFSALQPLLLKNPAHSG